MDTNRRRWKPMLVAGALAMFAAAAHADPPPVHYCEIALDFSVNGKKVAAPSAIVEFGQEAEITIGNPEEHAWRFRILTDAPTVVRRANVIAISLTLEEIAKDTAYARASPEIKAVPGQRIDIETIFTGGDGRNAHIGLVANPRTDAEIEAVRQGAVEGEP